jgi:hypothetical protein
MIAELRNGNPGLDFDGVARSLTELAERSLEEGPA